MNSTAQQTEPNTHEMVVIPGSSLTAEPGGPLVGTPQCMA